LFGSVSFVLPVLCNAENSLKKVEFHDPKSLTHEFLIKQASSVSTNAASQLLMTTANAIVSVGENYRVALLAYIAILEEIQTVGSGAGNAQELSDLAIERRADVNDYKLQLTELEGMFEYVEKLVNSTAEVAFLAGSEFLSSSLTEKLHSTKSELSVKRKEIEVLEGEIVNKMAYVIVES